MIKRKPQTRYLPKSMEAFLKYGVDSIEDESSFEVFVMKLRTPQIIQEWGRNRTRLMHGWEHDFAPYAEALSNGDTPQTDRLKEIYEKERTNDKQ